MAKLTVPCCDIRLQYACWFPFYRGRINDGFLTPVLGGPGFIAWSAFFCAGLIIALLL